MAQTTIRSLDHVVLPVSGLDAARQRLTALGFTVAPDGHHPFGTSNCCIFFEDGTFLEPLDIRDEQLVEEAIAQGNQFVARDKAYRAIHDDGDGFSAVVLATGDAIADHAAFQRSGMSAGDLLDFSRQFIDAEGKADEAVFRLAFAAEPDSDDAFFFTCQRIKSPSVDRSVLQEHPNGVKRIASIFAGAQNPGKHAPFLEKFLECEPLVLGSDLIYLFGKSAFQLSHSDAPNLRLTTVMFSCVSLDEIENILQDSDISYTQLDGAFIVPPAPGQGATFIFTGEI